MRETKRRKESEENEVTPTVVGRMRKAQAVGEKCKKTQIESWAFFLHSVGIINLKMTDDKNMKIIQS